MKALRAWAAQVGRTINTGKYDDHALNPLMTSELTKTMKSVLGPEVGNRYPGPLPFTPIKVTVISSTQRNVAICGVANGFSLNPMTGRPVDKFDVEPSEAGAIRQNGRWIVSKLDPEQKYGATPAS